MKEVVIGLAASLALFGAQPAQAERTPCYSGFELSDSCVAERGLTSKVATYRQKIAEALPRLHASYKIDLRVVGNPEEGGYDPAVVGDVFTDVVRDDEMRNQSFVINVTAEFLERQPELLFEASALHEICHVINDDLTGYHRNGGDTEAAEERCVRDAVGARRYEDYLRAYASYQRWDPPTYERFLARVKDVVLAPAPSERDEADARALAYLRAHADGNEHFLVDDGALHDETVRSTKTSAGFDPARIAALVKARRPGKPIVFFHNHPADAAEAAMFPSRDDFAVAALLSFIVYREDPRLAVDFRVLQLGAEDTVVSYGYKATALAEIKQLAAKSRRATAGLELRQGRLDARLADESFNEYLRYACPVDLTRADAEVCKTRPQRFLWPSQRFFIRDRAR